MVFPNVNVFSQFCRFELVDIIQHHFIKFLISVCSSQVSVTFDKALVAPSDSVNLTISACSQSFIGVLAVDKSVLLLKSGNDLSSDIVSEYQSEIRKFFIVEFTYKQINNNCDNQVTRAGVPQ